jgi:hypothetical protein
MASLNDFIDPDLTTSDVIHSSGYAQAASGAGAGGLSMEQRRQALNKPRIVGAYNKSMLGQRYAATKARTADQTQGRAYDASKDSFDDKARFSNRQANRVAEPNVDASVAKRQHFIEPPARGHNPYA